MSAARLLLASALAAACSGDLPAPPNHGESSTGGGGSSSAGTVAADSTAGEVPGVEILDVRLDFEIKASIDVTIVRRGQALEVTIDTSKGYGVVPGDPLLGVGRIDAYPEVGATLYTATFDAPANADGPCGDASVSLALALHHDDDADVIAGGLTAYCGAGVFFGVPAIEPLRISGRMP
jgi:hypothetical protein